MSNVKVSARVRVVDRERAESKAARLAAGHAPFRCTALRVLRGSVLEAAFVDADGARMAIFRERKGPDGRIAGVELRDTRTGTTIVRPLDPVLSMAIRKLTTRLEEFWPDVEAEREAHREAEIEQFRRGDQRADDGDEIDLDEGS